MDDLATAADLRIEPGSWIAWWVLLASLPLYLVCAASLHGLSLFTHEAVHGVLSTNRTVNRLLGIVCAVPVLQNHSAYKVLILRIPALSTAPESCASDSPLVEVQRCFEKLTDHGIAIVGGDPFLRSAQQPRGLLLSNRRACGALEDTFCCKRLFDQDGNEMLSAHLSCFGYQTTEGAVSLLKSATFQCHLRGLPAMFVAVPRADSDLIVRGLGSANGIVTAPATVFVSPRTAIFARVDASNFEVLAGFEISRWGRSTELASAYRRLTRRTRAWLTVKVVSVDTRLLGESSGRYSGRKLEAITRLRRELRGWRGCYSSSCQVCEGSRRAEPSVDNGMDFWIIQSLWRVLTVNCCAPADKSRVKHLHISNCVKPYQPLAR